MASFWFGGRATLLYVSLALAACSGGDGGSSAGELGSPCASSGDCLSNVCLPFSQNFEDIPGVCSTACTTSADCASGGVCLPDVTHTVQNACWRQCSSSSDCADGVDCIWDPTAALGVCAAVSLNICASVLSSGAPACGACVANACCQAYEACQADATCGRDFAACSVGPCVTALSSSGAGDEMTLAGCIASACSPACQ